VAKGDHVWVWFQSPVPFRHHGIDCGDGTVIHYFAESWRKQEAAIQRTPMSDFSRGAAVHVIRFAVAHAPDEVVRRAESRLGERRYNLLFHNCEHFARWCKTGDHVSEQVEGAGMAALWWITTVVPALAPVAVVFDAYYQARRLRRTA
jgi:hypothetical protein